MCPACPPDRAPPAPFLSRPSPHRGSDTSHRVDARRKRPPVWQLGTPAAENFGESRALPRLPISRRAANRLQSPENPLPPRSLPCELDACSRASGPGRPTRERRTRPPPGPPLRPIRVHRGSVDEAEPAAYPVVELSTI